MTMASSSQNGSRSRRVVVTGVGGLCAVGNTAAEIWDGIAAGRSGIAPITRFDPEGYETQFAGEVKGFDPAALLGRKEHRRMDRYTQLAVVAAKEAVAQSGLDIPSEATRVGTLIGTAMGGVETFEAGTETLLSSGPRRISPFFVPMLLPNMASGTVSIESGSKGPNYSPVSACASSAHALGEAMLMIRNGIADAMVTGGSEAPVTRMGVAGFNAMGALSTRNDDPEGASRPFDKDRDGFVLAEGAAVLVLEEREHALARGATILGELSGYGTTDDANHMVQPAPGGEGIARAMELALADAGISADDIDYVNAHGTSTQLNEKFETQALLRVFGDRTGSVPVSSTKSMTGHLLGAAGSLEALITLAAMEASTLPPTINQQTPDPDCPLDTVPNSARPDEIRHAMSNSMGFGGHNVSLILSRPDAVGQ
jgi:3-oxoacyl-[acyl-carrier-protein] synthase II